MSECPVCGAPMIERTARRGSNAGGQFWGCSNYPRCKGTRELDGTDNGAAGIHQAMVIQNNILPIRFEAEPLRGFSNMQSFETIACDSKVLDKIRNKKLERKCVQQGAKFRVDYSEEKYDLNQNQRELCAIVLRLLCRGRITTNSPSLEAAVLKIIRGDGDYEAKSFENARSAVKQDLMNLYPFDSDREAGFAKEVLSEVLGENWSLYTTPQVYLSSLSADNEQIREFVSQRVDFLVSADGKDYIIELDGPEHLNHLENDKARDSFLVKNGYKVFRYSNDEYEEDSDDIISELSNIIECQPNVVSSLETVEKQIVALKFVHQIQIAIASAIEKGVISYNARIKVVVKIVGISDASVKKLLTEAIVDLKEVFDNYCALYGIEPFFDCSFSDNEDATICFGCVKSSTPDMVVVSDISMSKPVENTIPSYRSLRIKSVNESILHYFLTYVFRFEEFREGQYAGLERLLNRQDTIVLMPTGSGKSLIYQLAALLVPGKTFIISPLVSLMRDQLGNLADVGIDCAIYLSRESRPDKELNSPCNIMIYATPERLQIDSFRESVENMLLQNIVFTVAVDEAHCISEWGHDFRTAYLNIGRTSRNIFKSNGLPPVVLALTGTASTAVLKDVKRELQINGYDATITPETFDRSELKFKVVKSNSAGKANKLKNIVNEEISATFHKSPARFYNLAEGNTNCGIIFCPHVNGDYGIIKVERQLSIATPAKTDVFSGGTPNTFNGDWESRKKVAADNFKSNQINVLVATKAFGMGIDKPNVRFTIHYGVPGSIEAFYQEAGRAGRDGKDAICALILSKDNDRVDQKLLDPTTPLSKIAEEIDSQGYDEKDDISRMLYFHVNSFKGIKDEIEKIDYVLQSLFVDGILVDRKVILHCDDRDRLDAYQKAVQRLLVLGIIQDCTVNYNQNELNIVPGTSDQVSIENNFAEYVRGYNEGRVAVEMLKMDRLLGRSDIELARGASLVLIEFIYDTIEKGRRRGLREIVNAAEAALNSDDPDTTLRQRIVRYFESTYLEELNSVIESRNLGFEFIKEIIRGKVIPETNEVVGGIRSPNEAMGLRGEVSRNLESNPDHPGLLALRALSEMYSKDPDGAVIVENFGASIKFAINSYAYNKDKLVDFIEYFLEEVLQHNQDLFIPAMKKLEEHYPTDLIAESLLDSNDLTEVEKVAPAIVFLSTKSSSILKTISSIKGE